MHQLGHFLSFQINFQESGWSRWWSISGSSRSFVTAWQSWRLTVTNMLTWRPLCCSAPVRVRLFCLIKIILAIKQLQVKGGGKKDQISNIWILESICGVVIYQIILVWTAVGRLRSSRRKLSWSCRTMCRKHILMTHTGTLVRRF